MYNRLQITPPHFVVLLPSGFQQTFPSSTYPWQVKPDGDHPQKKLRGESHHPGSIWSLGSNPVSCPLNSFLNPHRAKQNPELVLIASQLWLLPGSGSGFIIPILVIRWGNQGSTKSQVEPPNGNLCESENFRRELHHTGRPGEKTRAVK